MQLRSLVYSTPDCVQCNATYRALDSKGVAYEVVDLSQDDAAYGYVTDDLGYGQAPILVVNNDDRWTGFRPDHNDRIATQA